MSKAVSLVSWKAFGGGSGGLLLVPAEEALRRGTRKTLSVLLGGEGAR